VSDAHAVARACAEALWAQDRASQDLGMTLEHVAPGEARLAMTVTAAMANGHGQCHGGYIFTLADSAFAFACNTYDARTVAQSCSVTYLRPARVGERLVAHAVERARAGRSGLYDVTVRGADGAAVAEFRGQSRTVSGTLLSGAGDAPHTGAGGSP
jgi:acyl-CoA thioesterase